MDWIYNSRIGTVMQVPSLSVQLYLKSGLGWHGPFDSKEKAIAFYNTNKSKNPGWIPPTGIAGGLGNVPGGIADVGSDAADSVGEAVVGKLGLSNENITMWMIRIGEILLGIVLIGVGVAKLSGTTNVIAKAVKAKL